MKKAMKVILLFLLGVSIGIVAACVVYYATIGEVAWQDYVENELIPNAVLVLTSISTICLAAIPIVNRVTDAVEKFKTATQDVNDTVENGKKTDRALAAQDEKIASFSARFDEMERIFHEGIASVKSAAENSEKILRLGFCNTEELVKKGYAKEIQKVGAIDEQNAEET